MNFDLINCHLSPKGAGDSLSLLLPNKNKRMHFFFCMCNGSSSSSSSSSLVSFRGFIELFVCWFSGGENWKVVDFHDLRVANSSMIVGRRRKRPRTTDISMQFRARNRKEFTIWRQKVPATNQKWSKQLLARWNYNSRQSTWLRTCEQVSIKWSLRGICAIFRRVIKIVTLNTVKCH